MAGLPPLAGLGPVAGLPSLPQGRGWPEPGKVAGEAPLDAKAVAAEMRELEEENEYLRGEMERLYGGNCGSRKSSARSEDGCFAEDGWRTRRLNRSSSRVRRTVAFKDTAAARLNEALMENEEVLQRNRELHEQIGQMQRTQQVDREHRTEQEAAVQDLLTRVKLLEGEKLELQHDLHGSNQKLVEMQRLRLLQQQQQLQQRRAALDRGAEDAHDQPEAEPHGAWGRASRACHMEANFACSQEQQLVALQQELGHYQLENQQLMGSVRELRSMFEAERQAAEQARRDLDRLQGKLAMERMRGSRPQTLRSSTSSSGAMSTDNLKCQLGELQEEGQVSPPMQEPLSEEPLEAAMAEPEPHGAPSPEAPKVVVGDLQEHQEEGACDWLRGKQPEQEPGTPLKSPRAFTLDLLHEARLDSPDQPWWWSRLFGSMLCCTRPPPMPGKPGSPRPPGQGPVFRGGAPN